MLGNMKLPHSAEILMKKTTYNGLENISEELREKRKKYWEKRKENATIVVYDDDLPIHTAVNKRLKEKGYAIVRAGKHGWDVFTEFKNLIDTADTELDNDQREMYFKMLGSDGIDKYYRLYDKLIGEYGILYGGTGHAYTIFAEIEEIVASFMSKKPYEILVELDKIRKKLSDLRLEILSRKKEFMDKETIQALDELESFLNKIEDYCKKLNKIEEEEFKEKYGDDKDGL